MQNSPTSDLVVQDIGWFDVQRIHGSDVLVVKERFGGLETEGQGTSKTVGAGALGGFDPFDINLEFDRFVNCLNYSFIWEFIVS